MPSATRTADSRTESCARCAYLEGRDASHRNLPLTGIKGRIVEHAAYRLLYDNIHDFKDCCDGTSKRRFNAMASAMTAMTRYQE